MRRLASSRFVDSPPLRAQLVLACVVGFAFCPPAPSHAQTLPVLSDMLLDSQALLMPRGATYGPAINGIAHQTEAVFTVGDYQYATWYHLGASNEDVYLARRNLSGGSWETMDTGANLVRGDAPAWDNHNVTVLGVAGDGSIHLSYDHHGHDLRYRNTGSGAATGAVWNTSLLNAERSSLNAGGATLGGVTYPRFFNNPNTGDLHFTYRTGGSGNGDVLFGTYDSSTGLWDAPHEFIDGQAGTYVDAVGASTNRNAYLNGVDVDASGRIHTTWTWRESAGGSNHDIMYAYSDDGGDTWRNNAGAVVGTVGSPINLNSPGIRVVEMDRRNTLMNQQTQAVEPDGTVHAIMWHASDENANSVSGFTAAPAAYFHYFRDSQAQWARNELPTARAVGSRPDLGYDADGNLYVSYLSPGPGDGQGVTADYYTNGDLVIATASKATRWQDWEIVHVDTRDFVGEPRLDHTRLQNDGVVSIFVQENGNNASNATGSPLRVLEFEKLANHLVWAGDDSANWNAGVGTDWDSQGDDLGDSAFASGSRVTFDDSAASFALNITEAVSPSETTFRHSGGATYTVSGSGIAGTGGLRIVGGGTAVLQGGAHTYSGDTRIENGTLALSGSATIAATPTIHVAEGATLDVTGVSAAFTLSSGQTLINDSATTVAGNVTAASGSVVTGTSGVYAGNVTMAAGSTLRVGGATLPSSNVQSLCLIDDFNADSLASYTATVILDTDPPGGANSASWQTSGGELFYQTTSYQSIEQSALIHNGTSLAVGEEVIVEVNHNNASQDIGLYVGGTAPVDGVRADYVAVYARSGGGLFSRGFDGGGEFPLASAGTPIFDTLFIARTANNTYEAGYYDGDNRVVVTTRTPTTPNDAEFVGFYTDVRGAGSLGAFDNFAKIMSETSLVGQSLTFQGDLTLQAGATVQIDIGDCGVSDLVIVTGDLTAGGTLALNLDASLDSLVDLGDGDYWRVFDSASYSGTFAEFDLPALASGLFWDTTRLLIDGTLSITDVAPGLLGDFNGDNVVDAADYTVWRDNLGAADSVLAPGSTNDGTGLVDAGDYLTWRANYGSSLPTLNLAQSTPEPGSLLMTALVIVMDGLRRRRW